MPKAAAPVLHVATSHTSAADVAALAVVNSKRPTESLYKGRPGYEQYHYNRAGEKKAGPARNGKYEWSYTFQQNDGHGKRTKAGEEVLEHCRPWMRADEQRVAGKRSEAAPMAALQTDDGRVQYVEPARAADAAQRNGWHHRPYWGKARRANTRHMSRQELLERGCRALGHSRSTAGVCTHCGDGEEEHEMARSKRGMGFKAAVASAAAGAAARGKPLRNPAAVIAAGARKASPAAVRRNPNLKKVSGVGKRKGKAKRPDRLTPGDTRD